MTLVDRDTGCILSWGWTRSADTPICKRCWIRLPKLATTTAISLPHIVAGRPVTYGAAARGRLVVTAKTHPQPLGLLDSHWTLDRLGEYVHQRLSIPVSRSQSGAIPEQAGVKWYQEKTYFTESPNPQFAEQRGRL